MIPRLLIALEGIREMAKRYGWEEIDHQENIYMIRFAREGTRLNIYYSKIGKMTVSTTLTHPFKGRRQLFRKNIGRIELDEIMRYPRTHTKKGYYTR